MDKHKLILFNDVINDTTKDWEWSVFDSNYVNNEEIPIESKKLKFLNFKF